MSLTESRETKLSGRGEEGFDLFYQSHYGGMLAVARALVGASPVAEDLVQESFLAAHRNWHRIGRYENRAAWVRRVLINKATSFHRRLGAERRANERLHLLDHQAVEPVFSAETDHVWGEVRRLPRRQAQVTALFYVGQLEVEEIGRVLGCSAGAVKSHLHRARETLARRLRPSEEES